MRLTPVQSSFLFASMPACIALGMIAAQRTARLTGRVPAVFLYKWAAVALLALMALAPGLWRVKGLIVPIYLLRSCAANCTRALSRSILMDFVPKVRPPTPSVFRANLSAGWTCDFASTESHVPYGESRAWPAYCHACEGFYQATLRKRLAFWLRHSVSVALAHLHRRCCAPPEPDRPPCSRYAAAGAAWTASRRSAGVVARSSVATWSTAPASRPSSSSQPPYNSAPRS